MIPDVPILGASKQIPNDTVDQIGMALAMCLEHLAATDTANASANCAEMKPRPLTVLVGQALTALQEAVQ